MGKIMLSLATMVGMFPKADDKGKAMILDHVQTWLKGIVFALAAVAALFAAITGGAWFYQVIVPRLLGA